jgi:hypothetical protein
VGVARVRRRRRGFRALNRSRRRSVTGPKFRGQPADLRTQIIEACAQYAKVRNRKSNRGTDQQIEQPGRGTGQVPANERSDNRQNDSHDWGHQLPFMG